MNLSRERTSLSSKEESKSTKSPISVRKCASCGCLDRPSLVIGSATSAGEHIPLTAAQDEYTGETGTAAAVFVHAGQLTEHFVTIELRYLKSLEHCTEYLRGRGWKPRMHQGRAAMERLLCRSCMNEHAVMEREFAQRSDGEPVKRTNHQSFYQKLCSE